jgi:hypothetical protein
VKPPDLRALLAAETGLREMSADPVAHFRFSSGAQRAFVKALGAFDETALRAGNQAGKTTVAAFVFVAIARGCTSIDGEPLPMLGAPNTGAVLAKGRAMAKESVIKAYRQAVGKWPHHLEKNGNTIEAIWVKPNRSTSDDWHEWSCIRFFVEGGQSVAGMRLDWAHADEPPDWPMWLELRMRGKANRHFVRAITFTPIDKREWSPLREDFKGCERDGGRDRKVMLRMSVYDNKALGPEHLKAVESASKGLLQQAKLYGEWVDTTGANPFDAAGLKRWRERCVPGTREKHLSTRGVVMEWEWWEEPDKGESYFVVADPSAGIEDDAHQHDPAGIVVVARRKPRVVARYNGYCPAYELGKLGRYLAERYNNAMLVWERNSGYGESFWLGTGEYRNVYIEHHRDSRGVPLSQRIGWTTTATTRGTVIGALQKAILEDGLLVLSLEAVDSLENVVLDRNGRSEAGPGSHDEDMIILGLAAHLCETMPLYTPPAPKGSDRLLESLGLKRRLQSHVVDDPFTFR